MLRVAVLCSGRGSNLHHLLDACSKGLVKATVTLVVSDKPDNGALDIARAANVPAVVALPKERTETSEAYDARLLEILEAEHPDLVVLAGYMRVVGTPFCRRFQERIVNIHPSLLPAFKGLKAVRQALDAGATIVGCTTHIVNEELDGGPILLQAAIDVRPGESEEHLAKRVLALEHLLLPRTVQLFAEERIRIHPFHRTTVSAPSGIPSSHAAIQPGPSWLDDKRVKLVAGALYSEGF